MSDMVKAALIIGVAIVFNQGFYEVKPTQSKYVMVKHNKFTGTVSICYLHSKERGVVCHEKSN